MCISQLRKEVEEKYEEWLEMGLPLENILLNLLDQEREKNVFLEKRMFHLQNSKYAA